MTCLMIYPISETAEDGLATINWIAEVTYDDPSARENVGWFRQVEIDDFARLRLCRMTAKFGRETVAMSQTAPTRKSSEKVARRIL